MLTLKNQNQTLRNMYLETIITADRINLKTLIIYHYINITIINQNY